MCPSLEKPTEINKETESAVDVLDQWFPTGVPRHTRVPWGGARGAASYCIPMKSLPISLRRGAAKH